MEKIAKYYNVNADIIVSEYMNIVKADESLFMFLGETSNLIFTHAIYPADVVKFETAIKEVDEGEQVYVSIRLKSRDGDYRWMRVFIKPYHDTKKTNVSCIQFVECPFQLLQYVVCMD